MNSRRSLVKLQLRAALFLLLPTFALSAEAHPEVAAVVSKMASFKGFRARLTISSGGGSLSGTLSFSQGKTHFQLSDGRVIASAGRELVVYNPGTQVAGKQTMAPGGGGLGWLLSGFKTRVNGSSAILEAENPAANVQEVRLRWREGHVLEQLSIRHKGSGDWTTMTLSGLRQVDGFPVSLFSYDAPAGSRTVENPLNQSN